VSGQTVFDLSILLYGNSSNAVKIIQDNPALQNVTRQITPGTVISYTATLGNKTVDYFTDKKITPDTGQTNPLSGSGFDLGFKTTGFK
jgi:hypothetical protein